ncbi:MAG: hypothetical protein IPK26_19915 [Planctomycetes bacterium]|nr:hypothetical protein [Planctomycetota bacterium]
MPFATTRCIAPLLLSFAALAQTHWLPAPTGPGPRSDTAAVFDPIRGRFLWQGGWDGTNNLTDTWAFDGTGWTQLAPSPGPISSHRLAFLPSQGVALAFGGWDGVGMLSGTWSFDGSSWTVRQPAHVPPARFSHAMVADRARSVVVLFGGACGSACALDDTWEYDGVDWLQRQPAARPTGRYSAGMAYDDARQHVLLFGGRTRVTRVNDTWTWNGSTWTALGSGGPAPRSTPVMDYDPARERVVLFGGFAGAYVADTWEHDGTAWLQRTPATPPPARGFAAMAWDGNLERMLLVGGETGGGVTQVVHSYGAVQPASCVPFGSGCSAFALQTVTRPWLGDTLRVAAAPLGPGVAVFAMGFSDTQWNGQPLPIDLTGFGMTGCQLAVAAETIALVAVAGGSARVELPVPALGNLLGVTFFVQAVAADPAIVPAGVGASAPARAVIGAR